MSMCSPVVLKETKFAVGAVAELDALNPSILMSRVICVMHACDVFSWKHRSQWWCGIQSSTLHIILCKRKITVQ